ncbi:large-conductance mechanosensitive channel protein MscL, partial [Dysosmobacter welbionis]
RLLQVQHVPVFGRDMLLPVPLVHIDGVEVVHLLVPPDGVHVGVEARSLGELVPLQGQALPFGQGVDHLAVGAHIGDVKGDRALHAVQVIVQAGAAVHEQGGGDPVQVQAHTKAVLKLLVDQLDGPLELVVAEGHPVAGGDGGFTHSRKC